MLNKKNLDQCVNRVDMERGCLISEINMDGDRQVLIINFMERMKNHLVWNSQGDTSHRVLGYMYAYIRTHYTHSYMHTFLNSFREKLIVTQLVRKFFA
jgi:hypothetical protein